MNKKFLYSLLLSFSCVFILAGSILINFFKIENVKFSEYYVDFETNASKHPIYNYYNNINNEQLIITEYIEGDYLKHVRNALKYLEKYDKSDKLISYQEKQKLILNLSKVEESILKLKEFFLTNELILNQPASINLIPTDLRNEKIIFSYQSISNFINEEEVYFFSNKNKFLNLIDFTFNSKDIGIGSIIIKTKDNIDDLYLADFKSDLLKFEEIRINDMIKIVLRSDFFFKELRENFDTLKYQFDLFLNFYFTVMVYEKVFDNNLTNTDLTTTEFDRVYHYVNNNNYASIETLEDFYYIIEDFQRQFLCYSKNSMIEMDCYLKRNTIQSFHSSYELIHHLFIFDYNFTNKIPLINFNQSVVFSNKNLKIYNIPYKFYIQAFFLFVIISFISFVLLMYRNHE